MSLINDALKKAQRQRAEKPLDTPPPMPGGGGRIAKRSAPMGAQTIVLIVAACVVLIVLSAVGTVFLLQDDSPVEKPAPSVASAEKKPAATPEISVAPIVVLPPVNSEKKSGGTPVAPPPSPPAEQKTEPAPVVAAPTPPVETPATPLLPLPVVTRPPPPPDERIYAFLDTLRVNSIRVSGTESRVLMNQRVYLVNDIVDRSLNLKLIEVQTDHIKFTDGNGIVYTKKF